MDYIINSHVERLGVHARDCVGQRCNRRVRVFNYSNDEKTVGPSCTVQLYTTRNNSICFICISALRMIGFLIDAVFAAVARIDKYANIIIITYCAR